MLDNLIDRCVKNDDVWHQRAMQNIAVADNKNSFCFWTVMDWFKPWFLMVMFVGLVVMLGNCIVLAVFPVHFIGFWIVAVAGYWHKNCSIKWEARG
jgi:hypothetical protein